MEPKKDRLALLEAGLIAATSLGATPQTRYRRVHAAKPKSSQRSKLRESRRRMEKQTRRKNRKQK